MFEMIEPTPNEPPNEALDSDIDTFDTLSDLFSEEDPTEHPSFVESLFVASEG